MNHSKFSGLLIVVLIFVGACSSIPDRPWWNAVPENSPFVIIPGEYATINSVLESDYTPFLDDITSSAIQLLSRIDSTANSTIGLESIILYPGAENQLETVWVTQAAPGFIDLLKENFYQRFAQNQYYFNEITIHKLHLQDRNLFAAEIHDHLLLSESSLGIEDAIRAYLDKLPRADLADLSLEPGHIVMNTPSLDGWIEQLALVANRPAIKNSLQGTKPALLSISRQNEQQQNREFNLTGVIPFSEEVPSNLVASISGGNAPITLDQYISSNAAAFGLFRLAPRLAPPASLPDTSSLDSILLANKTNYTDIAKTLDQAFSLVLYAESGFLSTGEHLYLRKVSDVAGLQQELADLENEGHINRRDGAYYIQSGAMAELIGSSLCSFQDFYLDVTGDVVVISKRRGLVEMVSSDRNRRRTMYYEQDFRNIKNNLPEQISSLFVTNTDFYAFIEPFLTPENYVNAITSKFDFLTVSTVLSDDETYLTFNMDTYRTQERSTPYREKWMFPTGAELSGPPVFVDIGGSPQPEVIFATESGSLYALAADGTVVMQGNTGTDQPIGSPVVYDWYATNQNVILLAAGNKLYGWNDNGEVLPKFPFALSENITSPLVVSDVDQNGLPDALVATADRRLHVLNGRGQNIEGWPVTTNAEINTKPIVTDYSGSRTIVSFSENAIHSWYTDGIPRQGFPKFINASFNGSPVIYDGNILGNAADGYLYSIGPDKMFSDSLNVFETTSDSSNMEAIYVSNSSLVNTPIIQNVTLSDGDQVIREPMLLTASSNGSVFLLGTEGQLRFTQNMGQPAAPSSSPFITDINRDNQDDIVALANFGRLYVWQISNGERIYSMPTSAMKYPVVADIDNDGYNELIAQTSEGLRCWTIYGNRQ